MEEQLINTISQRTIEPPDTMLWKYMNREKFNSLIENSSLFMANRKLWFAGDSSEGKLPRATEQELIAGFGEERGRDLIETNQKLQDRVFGASFYTGTSEVREMWDNYAPEPGCTRKLRARQE